LPSPGAGLFNPRMLQKKTSLPVIILAAACLSGLTGSGIMNEATASPANEFLQAKTLQRKLAACAKVDYLLFLPAAYNSRPADQWPLIFFLHGSGERGSDVWRVATHGPSKYIETHPDFPFIVVSPQCAEREHWSSDALMDLLDQAVQLYRVDTNRIYLTGLSMGGFGAWELASSYPERFAAVAPICGGGRFISVLMSQGNGRLDALRSLGIWAFHGAKDDVVPLAESERMVRMMKEAGCKEVLFTVYPEAKHNSWTETYNNPELYEWFLKHRRRPAK
jgi:predicted peptidase